MQKLIGIAALTLALTLGLMANQAFALTGTNGGVGTAGGAGGVGGNGGSGTNGANANGSPGISHNGTNHCLFSVCRTH